MNKRNQIKTKQKEERKNKTGRVVSLVQNSSLPIFTSGTLRPRTVKLNPPLLRNKLSLLPLRNLRRSSGGGRRRLLLVDLVAVGSRVLSIKNGRVRVGGGSSNGVLSSLSIQSGLRLSSKDGLSSFLELEVDEGDGDNEPVEDVGEDGSIGGGRVPSQNL